MEKLFVLKRCSAAPYLAKDLMGHAPTTASWTYTQHLDKAMTFHSHHAALLYIYQANTNAALRVSGVATHDFNEGDVLHIVEITKMPPQYKEVV